MSKVNAKYLNWIECKSTTVHLLLPQSGSKVGLIVVPLTRGNGVFKVERECVFTTQTWDFFSSHLTLPAVFLLSFPHFLSFFSFQNKCWQSLSNTAQTSLSSDSLTIVHFELNRQNLYVQTIHAWTIFKILNIVKRLETLALVCIVCLRDVK